MIRIHEFKRRQLISLIVLLWITFNVQPFWAADAASWYRGQLHAHSYWSDGRGFPEQAVAAYKQRGYHFLALTDHNRFAENENEWREVKPDEGNWPPNVCQKIYDAYLRDFGDEWVDSKTDGPVTSVRLKTYPEIKVKFEEPGKFILLPGAELTQVVHGYQVHQNYINLPLLLPCVRESNLVKSVDPKWTVGSLMAMNADEAKCAAEELKRPYLLMLNHPFWVYCDVLAQDLLDCPQIGFFEICNGGSEFAPFPEALDYTPEKFWDVANAFRCADGRSPVYGVGSDDAHFYDEERINGPSGIDDAWIMVRAAALTPEHLIESMQRGDFYATTGVLLDDVSFDPANKNLRVKVKAEPGVRYRIRFVTTKRNFDRTVKTVDVPAEEKRPARQLPIYSDDIGTTVKTVDDVEATYRLDPDDLYVRAIVESDIPCNLTPFFHPKVQTAWTQPFAVN